MVLTETFTLDGRSPASANSDLVGKNEFTLRTGVEDLWNVVNPWAVHAFPLWSKAMALVFVAGSSWQRSPWWSTVPAGGSSRSV